MDQLDALAFGAFVGFDKEGEAEFGCHFHGIGIGRQLPAQGRVLQAECLYRFGRENNPAGRRVYAGFIEELGAVVLVLGNLGRAHAVDVKAGVLEKTAPAILERHEPGAAMGGFQAKFRAHVRT